MSGSLKNLADSNSARHDGVEEKMKFSVITITYNSGKTLEETIQSVAAQTYDNMEYLIIDGGSTDNTVEIIKRYPEAVTHWISEPDRGISDAFNKGIRLATGDMICLINSDDILAEDALQRVARKVKPETDILYGNAIYFGENQKNFRVRPHESLDYIRKGMALVHPATFVRKRAYEQYGYFDLGYKCAMDRELLLRMYLGGAKFQYVDEDLAWMRLGGVSIQSFFGTTVPEDRAISIKYGMDPALAKLYGMKMALKFRVARFVRKFPFGDLVRKYFHAKTTDLNVPNDGPTKKREEKT